MQQNNEKGKKKKQLNSNSEIFFETQPFQSQGNIQFNNGNQMSMDFNFYNQPQQNQMQQQMVLQSGTPQNNKFNNQNANMQQLGNMPILNKNHLHSSQMLPQQNLQQQQQKMLLSQNLYMNNNNSNTNNSGMNNNNQKIMKKQLPIQQNQNSTNFLSKSHKIGDMIYQEQTDVTHSSIQTSKLANNQDEYVIEQLDLATFKLLPCTINTQHNHKHCPYYHNAKDRKRPDNFYSTELCEYIEKNEPCPYQDSCMKAHNRVEQLYQSDKYKTKFCSYFPDNIAQCDYGIFCSFAHSENDIVIELIHNLQYDSDFYMFSFKTVWCPLNLTPHDKALCVYAHNWQDYRRKPNVYSYEPIPCQNWKATEFILSYGDGCPRQFECTKCHGWKELEYHPKNYKCKPCQNSNNCQKQKDCPNYHSAQDKRVLSQNISKAIFRYVPKNRIVSNTFKVRCHQQDQNMPYQLKNDNQNMHNNLLQAQIQQQQNMQLTVPKFNKPSLSQHQQQQHQFSSQSFSSFNIVNQQELIAPAYGGKHNSTQQITVFNTGNNGSQVLQGGSQNLLDANGIQGSSQSNLGCNNNCDDDEDQGSNNNNWIMGDEQNSDHNSSGLLEDQILQQKSFSQQQAQAAQAVNNFLNIQNSETLIQLNSSQTFIQNNQGQQGNQYLQNKHFLNQGIKSDKKVPVESASFVQYQINEQDDEEFSEKKIMKQSNSQTLFNLNSAFNEKLGFSTNNSSNNNNPNNKSNSNEVQENAFSNNYNTQHLLNSLSNFNQNDQSKKSDQILFPSIAEGNLMKMGSFKEIASNSGEQNKYRTNLMSSIPMGQVKHDNIDILFKTITEEGDPGEELGNPKNHLRKKLSSYNQEDKDIKNNVLNLIDNE